MGKENRAIPSTLLAHSDQGLPKNMDGLFSKDSAILVYHGHCRLPDVTVGSARRTCAKGETVNPLAHWQIQFFSKH